MRQIMKHKADWGPVQCCLPTASRLPVLGKWKICFQVPCYWQILFGHFLLGHMSSPPTYNLLKRWDVAFLGFASLNLSFCLKSSIPPSQIKVGRGEKITSQSEWKFIKPRLMSSPSWLLGIQFHTDQLTSRELLWIASVLERRSTSDLPH